jgi:intein/homing endonuclease
LPWNIKNISIPPLNEDLSEFIGIHLGDGTLTKNFLRIFGDSRYDKLYFSHVSNMIKKMFNVDSFLRFDRGKYGEKHTMYIEVCSKKLCDFLHDFGIPYGDKIKGKARIPEMILSDEKLTISCLRGLVDSDGSVSKRGTYICLVFNSRNDLLRNQVWTIGKNLEIFTHEFQDEIGTNSWEKIVRYFNIVGSSNISYVIRFCERYYNKNCLYKRNVLNLYSKYNTIRLPFKMGWWSSGYDSIFLERPRELIANATLTR